MHNTYLVGNVQTMACCMSCEDVNLPILQSNWKEEDMTHRCLALLVILVALSMPAYSAEIVFSNLSPPDNSYNRSAGVVIGSPGMPIVPQIAAVAFTPDDDFTLTQIGVALFHITGTNSAMLSLDSSIGGLPDGTIESWSFIPLPPFGSNTILQTVTPDM